MSELDIKPILESLFFVSDSPIRLEVLVEILPELSKDDILEGIRQIQAEYGDSSKGIELAEIAGGYQFRTKPDWAEWVNRLKKTKAVKLSQAALETLAIVAYRQPVIRPTIEEIRGVDSGSVLHTLMERGLIKMMGRKDLPGRPIVYGTSKVFLELFSLRSLSDLPKLQEIQPPPAPEEISAQEITSQETTPQERSSQETSPQEISPREISNKETLKAEADEVTAEDPFTQPPPPRGYVVTSLQGTETTEAIPPQAGNAEIATLPSVARDDKEGITTQPPQREEGEGG